MPGLKVRAPVCIKYSLEREPIEVTGLNKVVTVDPMSTNRIIIGKDKVTDTGTT